MGSTRIRRPSASMVISVLALIVALGGTAFAGPVARLFRLVNGDKIISQHSLSGNRLRNHTLTGQQINLSRLGTVPNARFANTARFATVAGGAPPTGTAGGDLAGRYPHPTLAPPEAFHLVGAPGEPGFQNGWQNNNSFGDEPAGFYKDSEGVVHLRGRVTGGGGNTVIFQLPPGYQPGNQIQLGITSACDCQVSIVDSANDTATVSEGSGFLRIWGPGFGSQSGSVEVGNVTANSLWLDGISFRAGS